MMGGIIMLDELFEKRYSVRKFSDEKVSKEDLITILEAGNKVPTAKNNQPQRIYVLTSDEDLKKVDELSPCRYNAQAVLLFSYNKDEQWKSSFEEGVSSGVEDVSIVATHIMLKAAEIGLGTVWVNMFPNTKTEEVFGLGSDERSVLLMMVGHIAEGSHPAHLHTEKKDLSETVTFR